MYFFPDVPMDNASVSSFLFRCAGPLTTRHRNHHTPERPYFLSLRDMPNGHDDTTGNYEVALANAEKGYVSIPCHPGTKIPAVRWKQWQSERPTAELYREWFEGTRNNLAILTTGLVVFDCDHPDKVELVLRHCGDTPCQLRTPRGGTHLLYRARKGVVVGNHVKIKGQPIDIRAENGLALQPFSRTEHGIYEWLGEGLKPRAELPVAKIGWTRERQRRQVVQAVAAVQDQNFMEYRAWKWLEKVPGAVSGQRGHDATFRVACKLTQYFQLNYDQALRLLAIWNGTCEPPWTEQELIHKVEDALKKRR